MTVTRATEYPVVYLGASAARKIKLPTILPVLPMARIAAEATPRRFFPTLLLFNQVIVIAKAAQQPETTKNVAIYRTPSAKLR